VLVADRPEQPARSASPRTVIVIPARYASTRFPGKPLARLAGRPMIEHVYRRAAASRVADEVLVATDDQRIAEAVEAFGGVVRMTSPAHRSGTERLAEVAASLTCDLVVNVQGDEPLLDPAMIGEAVAPFADPALQMGTLRRRLVPADLHNPNVVKVVVDRHDYALYFSRAPIPHVRDRAETPAPPLLAWQHVGLYVYRREFLVHLAGLPPTPLEQAEMLEQLRALEHGHRIKAVETHAEAIGVDTPDDLERVRARFERLDRTTPAAEGRGVQTLT
jgi:3-deoxy-manno-octulosonate cytidylyltransferase (CMP-KDO synthetase)